MVTSKKRLAGRLNAQKARHVQAKNKNLETIQVIFDRLVISCRIRVPQKCQRGAICGKLLVRPLLDFSSVKFDFSTCKGRSLIGYPRICLRHLVTQQFKY